MQGEASRLYGPVRPDLRTSDLFSRYKPTLRKVAIGLAHGVLGELWQGPVDNTTAVISLPMSSFSRATLLQSIVDGPRVTQLTPLRQSALDVFQRRFPAATVPCGQWLFDSNLAVGHGMASSTADIVALIRCLADATGEVLCEEDLTSMLCAIERSDPVFRPSITLYKTSQQKVVEDFGTENSFYACYVLSGDGVETGRMLESDLLRTYKRFASEYAVSLERARKGLRARDLEAVAKEATFSALVAQNYLPNPLVFELASDYQKFGALGISRAHTGSVVALLFADPLSVLDKECLSSYSYARGLVARFEKVGTHGI